jgi:hypothetical protein
LALTLWFWKRMSFANDFFFDRDVLEGRGAAG